MAITSTVEHQINHKKGEAYSFIIQQTPAYSDPSEAYGDICFAYIKNTNEIDMSLEEIDIRLGGTSQSEIIKILGKTTGSPIGGETITPSNLNLGSGNIADGIFQAGNEITGISEGNELHRIYVGSSNTSETFNLGQDIIVPKNNVITLWATNISAEIDIVLLFNYHDSKSG